MRLFLVITLVFINFFQALFYSFFFNMVSYGHANVQHSTNFDYKLVGLYSVAILIIIITSLSKEFYFLLTNAIFSGVLFLWLLSFSMGMNGLLVLFLFPSLLLLFGILITNLVYFFWRNKRR